MPVKDPACCLAPQALTMPLPAAADAGNSLQEAGEQGTLPVRTGLAPDIGMIP